MKKFLLLAAVAATFASAKADVFSDAFTVSLNGETLTDGQTAVVSTYYDPIVMENPELAGILDPEYECKAEVFVTNITDEPKEFQFSLNLIEPTPEEFKAGEYGNYQLCYSYTSAAGSCLQGSQITDFYTKLDPISAEEYLCMAIDQIGFTKYAPVTLQLDMRVMEDDKEAGKSTIYIKFTHEADITFGIPKMIVTSNGNSVKNGDIVLVECEIEDFSYLNEMDYIIYSWYPHVMVSTFDGSENLTVTLSSIDNSYDFKLGWMSSQNLEAGGTLEASGPIDTNPIDLQICKDYCAFSKDELPPAPGQVRVNLKTSSEEIEFTIKCQSVLKLSISPKTAELTVGESLILNAEGYPEDAPNKTILWSSSDESIAKVDSEGKVTGIGVGKALIIASPISGISGTCDLIVNPAPILVESIELSPSNWNGIEGDGFKINAVVLPENATDKSLVWVSNDDSIATVDSEGNVMTHSPGEVDITAISTDGSGINAICHIFVDKLIIPVNGISIDRASADLGIGETLTLTATVFPENATDKTVSWFSDNASIATVDDNGNITALSLGTANIIASCGDYSAICEISVITIPVESIVLTPENWIGIEGRDFKIEAVILPENATEKSLDWSSSNDSIAIVDNDGYVSVLKEGNCVITATATDDSGVFAECIIISVAGVEGVFSDDDSITIYGINGLIFKKNVDLEELKQLTSGIYLIQQGGKYKKIIIP